MIGFPFGLHAFILGLFLAWDISVGSQLLKQWLSLLAFDLRRIRSQS
jgi:hypothetical protein